MTRFTIWTEPQEYTALVGLAKLERRSFRDQASVLLREGLERRGLIQKENRDGHHPIAAEMAPAGASAVEQDSITPARAPQYAEGANAIG